MNGVNDMTETMKSILKQIIDDYGLNCKRISRNNLEKAGTKLQYGTPHTIYYYSMRNIGKCIYMEYDEYRKIAREVMVFDI